MGTSAANSLPPGLASELEQKFFWWKPVGSQPRSEFRILAQAMDMGSYKYVRRLETVIGPHRLAEVMLKAEPGWIGERSWVFWRGRLVLATGLAIPEMPPRRSFDGGSF